MGDRNGDPIIEPNTIEIKQFKQTPRIFISGGTGSVGEALVAAFASTGAPTERKNGCLFHRLFAREF